MKKNALRILSALLVLVMVVSLAACGGGKFDTVKAFLEDPDTKAELDKSIASMVNDTMDVTLEGTDDTLIYNFKFSDDAMAGVDEETLKASLVSGLEESTFVSTFEDIASSVSEVVKAENVKVKVIYAKADGTELASREYTAKAK
ncbi:DUF4854 domain-containing protein [Acutalibacter muris]|uniref:DUF4854 domain-containing protein n=1 Tax=Acutalibacter muris TaxID=1796620 RepID=UPI001C3EDFCB|nr:DUF4854 domain-containing protein [Acutalibacter muris]